jgi:prepilin-type N-terminal cleavage/methylation domain-containing protein/prepilin-type processing-associated H-X9-DG protein
MTPVYRNRSDGFTLIELLVVIGIMSILAAMLLPVLARSKQKAQGMLCMNNTRQLTLAWKMYADDNADVFPPNEPQQPGWVSGTMNFDSDHSANTNFALLVDEQVSNLARYTRNAAIYKCPADQSLVPGLGARVRSVSMSQSVGSLPGDVFCNGINRCAGSPVNGEWLTGIQDHCQVEWRTFGKLNQMSGPNPADLWLLMDENPDSINDGAFAVECGLSNAAAKFIDYPAAFHGGAAGIAFADGHSEIHKWRDARTKKTVRYDGKTKPSPSPNNPDVAWLQARTSRRR